MWVSKGLERALTTQNITAGFRTTGIFSLNKEAVDAYMGPAQQFGSGHRNIDEGGGSGGTGGSNAAAQVRTRSGDGPESERTLQPGDCESDTSSSGTSDRVLQELRGDMVPTSQPMPVHHFVVGTAGAKSAPDTDSDHSTASLTQQTAALGEDPVAPPLPPPIASLLALPGVAVAPSCKVRNSQEPLVDYSRSLLLTSDDYIAAMEEKSRRREEARVQAEIHREQAQQRRQEKEEEKMQKNLDKAEQEAHKESRLAFKARWSKDAIRQTGESMQDLVKNPPPPAPGDYIVPYLGNLPPLCKNNMALRLAKRRAQKFKTGDPYDLPNGTPPPGFIVRIPTTSMHRSLSPHPPSRSPCPRPVVPTSAQ